MRWIPRIWWVAAGLLPAACGGADEPVEPPPAADPAETIQAAIDRPFTLRIGQSATIPGTDVSLTFHRVSEDSRCPTDVTCVWAGNARLELLGRVDQEDRQLQLNTGIEPRVATMAGLRIEIVQLTPAPTSDAPIPDNAYRATLKVTRAPR